MSVVFDVQGFKIENNKFIVKEFCAYDGVRICHYIFKAPFPWDLLPPPLQVQAKWLTDNYHAISWDSGFTPLHKFGSIIKDIADVADRIYVKGREKAVYLRNFTCKPIIELEEQPRLTPSPATCFYHTKDICMCAMSNVFYLYDNFIMS